MESFLLDIWRLAVVTGGGRPDAEVTLWHRNDHLYACVEKYLVPESSQESQGKVCVTATVMCGHGEASDVEYSLNKDLWILEKLAAEGETFA